MSGRRDRVLALSGGVGGAKLARGLDRVVAPGRLVVVCNTADDFEHLGLHISPDLDSVTYALAGINDEARGWGRADEGWRFMESLAALGGEDWFRLGDRDLAMHVRRSELLAAGNSLSEATTAIAKFLGIASAVVPMTDDRVRTTVETASGDLAFQHYFVRERCEPAVTGFRFDGSERATPSAGLVGALQADDLGCVLVCPSNPFVSVDPIVQLSGVEQLLRQSAAPVIAVSPIVGGRAVKGPAAKMMAELGLEASAVEVARHYARRELLWGFVLDRQDTASRRAVEDLGLAVLVCDTVMTNDADRERLAKACLELAGELRRRSGAGRGGRAF